MTEFEKLVLRGLWIIVNLLLVTQRWLPGTDEIMWAKDVRDSGIDVPKEFSRGR